MSSLVSVLDAIVADVRRDLAATIEALPEATLEEIARLIPAPPSFAAALRRPGRGPRVIAEVKRASPSKGPIAPRAGAAEVAQGYARAGAVAVSILTERRRFGGSLLDLASAAEALKGAAPLLRKDFIVARYQLLEARAAGASAALLIAAVHEAPALAALVRDAREVGLDALVEVHDERDLDRALEAGATIIGVNHRDLRTLAIDLTLSERLLPRIPKDALKVAESGITRREEMDRLMGMGFDAFLVGERFMAEPDPGLALARMLDDRAPSEGGAA